MFTMAGGCRALPERVEPSIEFTTVPEAGVGGSERVALISGRVKGARAGQQIVLFTRSGVWWVQPLTVQPFTSIESDSTWKNSIHLGTEYAAVLVEPGYRPPATTEALPEPGGAVKAIATVKGTGDFAERTRLPEELSVTCARMTEVF